MRLQPVSIGLCLLILVSTVSLAQTAAAGTASPPTGKGAVTGTISDQAGKGVAGAVVSAEGTTGFSQTATADSKGLYAMELPAGSYQISVVTGGTMVFQASITLSPSQVLTLEVAGPLVAEEAAGSGTGVSSPESSAAPPTSGTAAITGTISDQTGAPVANATLGITNTTGFAQNATTDGQGLYAAELPPGSYNVVLTAAGLKIFQASIRLSPAQVVTLGVAGALVSQETSTPLSTPAAPQASAAAAPAIHATVASSQTAAPASSMPATQAAPSNGTSSISGNVTDQTGAVLVGASVKISDASGVVATTTADDKGNYSVAGLRPGSYTVTVTQPGFKDFVASSVNVGAGVQLPLDAMMEPAGEKTEVNVSGQTVGKVETETAAVSGTITQKEVTTLGLNGRNFTQLIALTPGVSNQTGQDEAKVGVNGSVKYSVNGGRVEYNTFEVDGSDVLNAGLNGSSSTLMVYPSLDAIQEVKVLTSNYGAMYGRTASGTVLVTTKSGEAQWHADGYEFIRNEYFNARNYFDQTTKAPKYRRNDFGFTIGGPLRKNKTFIFWSEEFRLENAPDYLHPNFNHGVPSLAEREGDFSDVCPTTGDPHSPEPGEVFLRADWPDCPSPGGSSAFTGYLTTYPNDNVIAPSNVGVGTANGAALVSTNLIPLPNSSTGCNSSIGSCYDAVISTSTNWREELVRLDHTLTSNLQLSAHFIHDAWSTTVPVPQWPFENISNSFPTVQNKFVGPGLSSMVRLTHTIRPTILNETTASFTNSHITLNNINGPGGANYQRPSGLGEPGGACPQITLNVVTTILDCPMGTIFNNGFKGEVPGTRIGGTNQEYGGDGFVVDPSFMPFLHTNPGYSLRDNLSLSIRNHTLQIGAQIIYAQRNETNPAIGGVSGDVQGLLTFSNQNSGLSTGNAFADLLTLRPNGSAGSAAAIQSYTQDSSQLRYHNQYWIEEPYVQDDWKVNPRLTLNLGVRFSLFGLWKEKDKRAYNWVPSAYNPALAAQLRVDPCSGELLDISSPISPTCPTQPGITLIPIPINLSNPDPRIINGMVRCGVNGIPAGCMTGHLFNPAPRIGIAWDPRGDGKTSIRAGYGMFYEHGTGDDANTGSLEGSAPLVLSMTQNLPINYGCIGGSSYGNDPSCTTPTGAFPLNVSSIPTKAVWPYSQQWSLSVQRQLPRDMVAAVAYVGSRGTHLTVEEQINQLRPISSSENPFGPNEPIIPPIPNVAPGDCGEYAPPSSLGPGGFTLSNGTSVPPSDPAYINLIAACSGDAAGIPDVNSVRPYPGLGQIFSLQNIADSSYHALQAVLRRTRGPLTIGGSYSYSHSIDDSSDRSDTAFVNAYDLRSNRASSNYDERHLLNVSYIYNFPKLGEALARLTNGRPGEPVGDNQEPPSLSPSRFLHVIGDGWQISGITIFQSGTPFSVINGGTTVVSVQDNAGTAIAVSGVGGNSYPDIIRNPAPRPSELNNTLSFGPLLANPNLFVAPRGLTFGDAGRNFLNNPHRTNFDMSLLKNFAVREDKTLEFRAEAFNIFNHTQFRIYNPDLGNTGSNVISCYGGPNYSAGFMAPLVNGVVSGADCVTGNGFLHPVDAHRPRTIQFGLKFKF